MVHNNVHTAAVASTQASSKQKSTKDSDTSYFKKLTRKNLEWFPCTLENVYY